MQVFAATDDRCVWYGQCPTAGDVLNCYYDGPAKRLSADAASVLIELCPMLSLDPGKAALLLECKLVNYTTRQLQLTAFSVCNMQ